MLWYSVPWEKHRLMVSKMFLHILFYLILPTVFEGNTIGTDVENEAWEVAWRLPGPRGRPSPTGVSKELGGET